MIPRRVQVAGVVAAVSLVAYFAAALSDPGRAEAISYRLPALTAEGVDEISVNKNGSETTLKKMPNGWRVAAPKFGNVEAPEADQTQVDGIIGTFKEGVGMDLSEGFEASKAASFGLDKDVITVTFRNAGQELTQFKIGKKAGPSRTFITSSDGETVYRAMADLRRLFDKPAADYRLKNSWQVQFDKITSLSIQEPGGITTTLKRVQGPPTAGPMGLQVQGPKVWEAEGPTPALLDAAAIDSIGRSLAYPRAAEFADTITAEEAGIGQHFSFTLTTDDGISRTLLVGKKDEQGRAYARRAPDGDLIIIDKYTVDTLLKPLFVIPASAPTSNPTSAPVIPTTPGAVPPVVPVVPTPPAPTPGHEGHNH